MFGRSKGKKQKMRPIGNGSKKRTVKRAARRGPLMLVLGLMAGAAVAAWVKSRSTGSFEQPFEGQDLVDHASRASFPASDAPAY